MNKDELAYQLTAHTLQDPKVLVDTCGANYGSRIDPVKVAAYYNDVLSALQKNEATLQKKKEA